MSESLRRPYRHVLVAVLGVWFIVALGTIGWAWLSQFFWGPPPANSLSVAEIAVIAISSGVIAQAAILPGWSIQLPKYRRQPAVPDPADESPSQLTAETTSPPAGGGSQASSPQPLSPWALAIEQLGQAFLIGMMIRMGGTVALFIASSYYMQASATQIGIWVLAWHLILLLSEVIMLSREFRLPT